MHPSIQVAIGPGELIDKLTILDIKLERIADDEKRHNIRTERRALAEARDTLAASDLLTALAERLKRVNECLWSIEDDIRGCEHAGDFGPGFVALARAVYKTNDERAQIKRAINLALGSTLIEEKSYQPYS